VFDLADAPLVDSTAAKALDVFAHKLRRSGTQVCVAGARPSVRRALLSVGLREPEVWYTATAAEARERIGEVTDGSD
jgi:SulP family sulfate permease